MPTWMEVIVPIPFASSRIPSRSRSRWRAASAAAGLVAVLVSFPAARPASAQTTSARPVATTTALGTPVFMTPRLHEMLPFGVVLSESFTVPAGKVFVVDHASVSLVYRDVPVGDAILIQVASIGAISRLVVGEIRNTGVRRVVFGGPVPAILPAGDYAFVGDGLQGEVSSALFNLNGRLVDAQ
jgi:hypothetical protein